MAKHATYVLVMLIALGVSLAAPIAAMGQSKKPIAQPNRAVDQIQFMTPSCAEALAVCLANNETPGPSGSGQNPVQDSTSWYEKVKACGPAALRAPTCFASAVVPSEIDKMRIEVTALVAATTGADCALLPSGEKNPLCLPAPAAAVPASVPKPSVRRIEELTEISCAAKNQLCLVLLVRDEDIGRQVLIGDKQSQLVFLDPTRDRFCVVHTLEEAPMLASCKTLQLPITRDKGQTKMKIAKN